MKNLITFAVTAWMLFLSVLLFAATCSVIGFTLGLGFAIVKQCFKFWN